MASQGEIAWFNRLLVERDLVGKFVVFCDPELPDLQNIATLAQKHQVLFCAESKLVETDIEIIRTEDKINYRQAEKEFNLENVFRGRATNILQLGQIPVFHPAQTLVYEVNLNLFQQLTQVLNQKQYPTYASCLVLEADTKHHVASTNLGKLAQTKLTNEQYLLIIGNVAESVMQQLKLTQTKAVEKAKIQKTAGIKGYATASSAVSRVAHFFSDIGFVYPAFSQSEGQELSSIKTLNYNGSKTKIVSLAARHGAGQVLKAASKHAKTSALLNSAALGFLLPAMYNINRQYPLPVLHVGVQSIQDVSLSHSLEEIELAKDSGFALVSSSTVQEAQDLAVVAHLAQLVNIPCLHFFDGVYLSRQEEQVELVTEQQLLALKQASQSLTDLEAVFGLVSESLGRKLAPIAYHGPAQPDSVIAVMGYQSHALKLAVEQLNAHGNRIGVVQVTAYRPWSPAAFRDIVPRTNKILVLEHGSGLYEDILASYYGISGPAVISHQLPAEPSAIYALLPSMTGVHGPQVSFEEGVCVQVWDYKRDKTSQCQSSYFDLIKHVQHAQRLSTFASTDVEPLEISQIRINDKPIQNQYPTKAASCVLVNNLDIFQTYNPVETLAVGGTLIINAPVKGQDLFDSVPSQVYHLLVQKRATVYAVNAGQIAKDYTIFYGNEQDYTAEILEGVLHHLLDASLEKQYDRIKTEDYNVAYTKLEAIARGIKELVPVQLHLFTPGKHVALIQPIPTVPSEFLLKEEEELEHTYEPAENHEPLLKYSFASAYGLETKVRPDMEQAYRIKVTENVRLTPESYDRNVFHIEFDLTGTDLKYDIGEALGVHAENDEHEVKQFIQDYGLDPKQTVQLKIGNQVELRTVEQLLVQVLDLFGKPGKKFYQYLVTKMASDDEREQVAYLLGDADRFDAFVQEETPTFADLLRKWPSAKLTVAELIAEIPEIKPRHYSISSSQRVHPNAVHLLVVLVDWTTKSGEKRYGQATRFLSQAKIGQYVTVTVKPSVMKLPKSHETPVIMSGLGTGMAPFRAFVEERWYWKQQGVNVGPMVLYFGSRYRAMEYLYGEEMEAYQKDKIVQLRLAFSRDQKRKIYIQHRMEEDLELLYDLMVTKKGAFYLCGPTWPVPDVTNALLKVFSKSMSKEEGLAYIEELKEDEKYVLEVY
ncbi:hypothetical protein EDD86DRAFT_212778 [Gorgonomyces haynaldii]|nr:hypothetical protein EDD86DRAFT_212778 [Gorgonomyces haynaldii]